MNNPQHYQPLAHALHPPSTASSSHSQSSYNPSSAYQSKVSLSNNREEEEEEDEDDPDDADEGIVEEQLNRSEPDGQGSNPSPRPASSNGNVQNAQATRPGHAHEPTQEPERKRKPGRPRGSKNRKPRAVSQGTTRQDPHPYQPPAAGAQAQAVPSDPTNQTQQFYEFQWRILNLCAEFYGAAEELVKSTSPLVLAQCYQIGAGSSSDPLKMLTDAKAVCDNLLANPSRLALNPPAPVYPSLPAVYQAPPAPPSASGQSSSNASTSASKATTPMITNPQSFVVSLGAQAAYPHAQYPVFATGAAQYPTTYYHQYPYAPPATAFYPQQPILTAAQPQPPMPNQQPSVAPAQSTPSTIGTLSNIPSTGVLNQGAWSEEETEKLRKLAEDSRTYSSTGEIEWDWVISQYGNSRTRHQILIKATALGLKESSSRGVKRRREAEDDMGSNAPPPPAPSNANTVAPAASPAHSNATSTPVDSPALQHQQKPPASKAPTTPSNLPWPMPTVAVNTTSPMITTSTTGQDQQRTSYYRPRPGQDTSKPLTHNYIYQPTNGTGPRLNQENGK